MTDTLVTPESPEGELPWRELLLRSADLLHQRGWCQERMFHPDGRICALGAFWEASKEMEPPRKTVAHAMAQFREYNNIGKKRRYVNVSAWNDAPDRESYEVEAAFRLAAGAVGEAESIYHEALMAVV